MSKIRLHGSSSGYTEIAPVAASGNNTLTLPDDGTILSKDAAGAVGVTSVHTTNITATGIATITTAKIGAGVTISESGIEASGIGITCASINGTQIGGRRNIVINGAMNVAQRATSSTTQTYSYVCIDRFRTGTDGTDEGVTISQGDVSSGTTPYTEGFRKSLKITNGNQTSGAGAGDYIQIDHNIEAQNIAKSGWNYTSASSNVTLSFWIKSSVAQAFPYTVRTPDGTAQVFNCNTPALSANTWTKVTKTIPGNSNITIDNDTGNGFMMMFFPYLGTTFTTVGLAEDTWSAFTNAKHGAGTTTTTWWTTDDATWEITGVQLEVGPQATPFEHLSMGEELSLCQRYFQFLGGSNGAYDSMSTGSCASSTVAYVPHRLLTTMRSTPSFTLGGSASDFRYTRGSDQTPSAVALDQAGANMVAIRVTTSSTSADAATRLFNVNTTGSLQFSAEI